MKLDREPYEPLHSNRIRTNIIKKNLSRNSPLMRQMQLELDIYRTLIFCSFDNESSHHRYSIRTYYSNYSILSRSLILFIEWNGIGSIPSDSNKNNGVLFFFQCARCNWKCINILFTSKEEGSLMFPNNTLFQFIEKR